MLVAVAAQPARRHPVAHKGDEMEPIGMASREKTWDEKNSDERLEMLRRLVQVMVRQMDGLSRRLGRLETQLAEHEHVSSGGCVVPAHRQYDKDEAASGYDPLA